MRTKSREEAGFFGRLDVDATVENRRRSDSLVGAIRGRLNDD